MMGAKFLVVTALCERWCQLDTVSVRAHVQVWESVCNCVQLSAIVCNCLHLCAEMCENVRMCESSM